MDSGQITEDYAIEGMMPGKQKTGVNTIEPANPPIVTFAMDCLMPITSRNWGTMPLIIEIEIMRIALNLAGAPGPDSFFYVNPSLILPGPALVFLSGIPSLSSWNLHRTSGKSFLISRHKSTAASTPDSRCRIQGC